MPLAIELAATRVKLLSVQHIAEQLDDRFNLLTEWKPRCLAASPDVAGDDRWSHEPLPEKAKVLFRRLSVFAGGFTPETAQAICSGGGLPVADALAELSRLVDRSLLELVPGDGDERYRMLETIRLYAAEKLQESGEQDWLRDRHLQHFTEWAEQAEPKLRGPEQMVWWDRMETEHDNIRLALNWSLSGGEAQIGLRLAIAIHWFWYRAATGERA